MPIIFEGPPPYDLPVAQTAEARSEGEIVELTLTVSVPGIQPKPVRIRVQMTHSVAMSLVGQLGPAATMAELHARKS